MLKIDFAKMVTVSELTEMQKQMWEEALLALPDEHVKIFAEFVDGDHGRLRMITENIQQKAQAFRVGSKHVMDTIIEAEIKYAKEND